MLVALVMLGAWAGRALACAGGFGWWVAVGRLVGAGAGVCVCVREREFRKRAQRVEEWYMMLYRQSRWAVLDVGSQKNFIYDEL